MAYANFPDLQELIAQFPISNVSTPNTGQATGILEDIANEINVALDGAGVTVPVTAPAHFLNWLGRLNAIGAAAAVLMSMFPDASGPGETPAYAFWYEWYRRGLDMISDGTGVPGEVVTSSSYVLPSTYLTNNPDTNEDIGVIAEPMFSIGRVF